MWVIDYNRYPDAYRDCVQCICQNAAGGGHLEVLSWAYKHSELYSVDNPEDLAATETEHLGKIINAAALGGHVEVCRWAADIGGRPLRSDPIGFRPKCCWESAAEGGNLELLQWLAEVAETSSEIVKCAGGSLEYAVKGGRVEVVRWMKEVCLDARGWARLVEEEQNLLGCAAKAGSLAMLQFALDNSFTDHEREPCIQTTVVVSVSAARVGSLQMLQWGRANGFPWSAKTCEAAAKGGHFAALQWLRANGCAWDERTCTAAADNGDLEMLQWARANGCEWNGETCYVAAMSGHLSVLQWARKNGCDWKYKWITSADTFSSAASFGQLPTLKWLRANGCDWDAKACASAAEGGHLTVLQWLRANGCPWDSRTCLSRSVAVLEWAAANGVEWNDTPDGSVYALAQDGWRDEDVIEWLQKKCPDERVRADAAAGERERLFGYESSGYESSTSSESED
jgi:hypothetical protein